MLYVLVNSHARRQTLTKSAEIKEINKNDISLKTSIKSSLSPPEMHVIRCKLNLDVTNLCAIFHWCEQSNHLLEFV